MDATGTRSESTTNPRIDVGDPPARLLILLNPGRMSRPWLIRIGLAAEALGIPTDTFELLPLWEDRKRGRIPNPNPFAKALKEKNVKAVLSYTHNGTWEWPVTRHADGRMIPFFEKVGVPHLMWWSDHPQWSLDKEAIRPHTRELCRSPNTHHFLKNPVAADEVHALLGWPNCYGLPVAEDPERMRPTVRATPQFDIVAIVGSPPVPDPQIDTFLDADDPDVSAIMAIVARRVERDFAAIWDDKAPTPLRDELDRFGAAWIHARRAEPLTGSFRIFRRLERRHPDATAWLRSQPEVYFDLIETLWALNRWQRTFVLRYLGKYFKVGVFGSDWSDVGLTGSTWVPHDDQPAVYALGRIALNVSQAGDEEGVAHKPFQIAASGVPMMHIDRRGLSDLFEPGVEIATFRTPREAREVASALLANPARRARMAVAARERLERQHTWQHRVAEMLDAIGLPLRHERPSPTGTRFLTRADEPEISDGVSGESRRALA